MSPSIRNEWLAEFLAEKRDLITEYWIEAIRSEGILAYHNITDQELRRDLPPTVDSMISAFKTGDTEGPRQHSVGVIHRRLTQGFLLPDLQMSLHALETAVMCMVREANVGKVKELEALQSASNAYYMVALIAATVYEQLRAEQQRQFAAAYELGIALNRTLDLNVVLDTAVRKIADFVGAESAAILLRNPASHQDEVRAHYGLDAEVVNAISDICEALRCGAVEEDSIDFGRTVHSIPDARTFDNLDRWTGLLASHGRLSMVHVPLVAKQKRLGSILILWEKMHISSDSEKDFLLALASHIASAIQNATLYEEAQGKRELDVLLKASRLFSSSLDTQDILDKMSRMATEAVRADLAVVFVLDRTQKQLRYIAHYAKGKRATAATSRIIEILCPETDICLDILGPDFAKGLPVLFSRDEELPQPLSPLSGVIQSGMTIPIRHKDVLLGAFTLSSLHEKYFGESDVSLAIGLADLAAVAIENARLYEYERNIAETLQRSFLPSRMPDIEGYETAVFYRPALVEAEVGGDFYDAFTVSTDTITIVIGDVSGKGLKAAVSTATGKYMIRAYAAENPSPASVLTRFNRAFYEIVPEFSFMTVFYGMLDPQKNEFTYVSAGHDPPLFYAATSGRVDPVETGGLCLGIRADVNYVERTIQFQTGDALLLYTDGATDVKENGNRLEITGLGKLFSSSGSGTAEDIVKSLSNGISSFSHDRFTDDVALVVIKRLAGK